MDYEFEEDVFLFIYDADKVVVKSVPDVPEEPIASSLLVPARCPRAFHYLQYKMLITITSVGIKEEKANYILHSGLPRLFLEQKSNSLHEKVQRGHGEYGDLRIVELLVHGVGDKDWLRNQTSSSQNPEKLS